MRVECYLVRSESLAWIFFVPEIDGDDLKVRGVLVFYACDNFAVGYKGIDRKGVSHSKANSFPLKFEFSKYHLSVKTFFELIDCQECRARAIEITRNFLLAYFVSVHFREFMVSNRHVHLDDSFTCSSRQYFGTKLLQVLHGTRLL